MFFVFRTFPAQAELGAAGWLRYSPLGNESVPQDYRKLPRQVVLTGTSPVERSAGRELARGLHSMLGIQVTRTGKLPPGASFILGTTETLRALLPEWAPRTSLSNEGFSLSKVQHAHHIVWVVAGGSPSGELYGVFHLLEEIAQRKALVLDEEAPSAPIRWVNQWDNLDGSVERGYAGRSIFFDDGHVRQDLSRAGEYARLLASVGLNGCTVNNVNSDLRTLRPEMIPELARIADAFRPWGVRMSLSVDLSSPVAVGKLATFDPLDPQVIGWWQAKVDEIYKIIPDFAGFVIKADSEGRPGPSKYGRTPAEAANLVAGALKSHGGVVLYRGFVYNNHLDWADLKADRARAGYDNFHALDGQFAPNVVVQIKHGPIDFQVREPVSPLFAALRQTNQAIELQVTQEYTGQQRHMVFLVPMWKAALDTDLRADGRATQVKEIVEGKSFQRPLGGFVAVANVGLETNWLHHPMAMANLYGFGKLAWNPDSSTGQILDSWTRLTFGNDSVVDRTIESLLGGSWRVYEQYTGPLGLGTLTDIIGVHYGPGIESAERNGWGQWLRADHFGIGMDRTVTSGTGYIGQYPSELASVYESLTTCPDELLLFMHHVPFTYVLHSGKTVIQHVYDSHYEGAETAGSYVWRWEQLHGKIDEERYQQVLALFEYQAGHAIVWRDAVSEWFLRLSGVPDEQGRVGRYPDRIEAESLVGTEDAGGYKAVDVHPWETASGGKAVVCLRTSGCSLTAKLDRTPGNYTIAVQYYDLNNGASQYQVLLNGSLIGRWTADRSLPSAHIDGHTSTRFTVTDIRLEPGDTLTVRSTPDGGEPAPVDYIEVTPTQNARIRTE
ncbi:MAG TPA: alpha-glucuronidase family glycosyl hydrolase [Acidisarcina sp.]